MGSEEYFKVLINTFIEDADRLCYNIVFYEIPKNLTMDLHDYGFDFIKFGESAIIDLKQFTLTGHHRSAQRNLINKIEKEMYTFSVKPEPHSEEFLDELEEVSNLWLRGRGEKGFSLGFFKRDYLNRAPIAIVSDSTGKVVAFSNLMPVYKEGWSTIDLMRYNPETAPNGTMDYLFIKLFMYFKELGKEYFDMGMAPLSNVGTMNHSFVQEKLVYLVYKFGDHFYSFEGLRSYKEKYATFWNPLYVSYSPGTFLLYAVISLLMVDIESSKKHK